MIAEVAFQTQAPLADVKMYSDMLVEQKDLSDDSRKIAERISAQGERLNMMLEAVVRISVLESGLNSIEPKSQNLGNLLCEEMCIRDSLKTDRDGRILYEKMVPSFCVWRDSDR